MTAAEARSRVRKNRVGNGWVVSEYDPSRKLWIEGPQMNYWEACSSIKARRAELAPSRYFTVTNDSFSRDPWTGTFSEIVRNIIGYNESWQTNYKKKDFYVQGDWIMIGDGILAERVRT